MEKDSDQLLRATRNAEQRHPDTRHATLRTEMTNPRATADAARTWLRFHLAFPGRQDIENFQSHVTKLS